MGTEASSFGRVSHEVGILLERGNGFSDPSGGTLRERRVIICRTTWRPNHWCTEVHFPALAARTFALAMLVSAVNWRDLERLDV